MIIQLSTFRYFDAIPLGKYWGWEGEARFYHHTGPSSIWYATAWVPASSWHCTCIGIWSQDSAAAAAHQQAGLMCARSAFTQSFCSMPCLQSLCSYGMREALSIACGEGLEALWARHQQVKSFQKGFAALRLWKPPSQSQLDCSSMLTATAILNLTCDPDFLVHFDRLIRHARGKHGG
jgi:hypothetical protein